MLVPSYEDVNRVISYISIRNRPHNLNYLRVVALETVGRKDEAESIAYWVHFHFKAVEHGLDPTHIWAQSYLMAAGLLRKRPRPLDVKADEDNPQYEIGIIWNISGDQRVCKKCLRLAGCWLDALDAYTMASTLGCKCRCPDMFVFGAPNEAWADPLPGYKPGVVESIIRDWRSNHANT